MFIPIAPSIDTATAGSLAFRTAAIGIGGSAIGLGALIDVGGWGGGSSVNTGFGQVLPQSLGFGFEGYHHGFSQASPKTWAPEGGPSGPPSSSWNLPSSYSNGGQGGDPPHNGNGSNDGPGNNHNDDHHGDYDDKGAPGPSTPVTATPEPGTVVLLATGFLALIPVVRRRRRA